MPQLVEYVNKENITPTDRGIEARVQEGRRVGAFFNQVAESTRDFGNRTAQQIGSAIRDAGDAAVAYTTHREIGQGIGAHALLENGLTNKWNDIAKSADPNDPSVRQKFIEEQLSPALEKFNDAFHTEGGQKWAQTQTRDTLNHMYQKTAADMGTLAAQAISNNVRTVGNTTSNTAYNDPSSVDHLLSNVDASIGALVDSSPNLKGAPAGRAKTEISEKQKEAIVKAGAMGAIAKSSDPEKTAEEWTRRYPQYITGDEAKTLAGNARTQIRAQRADEGYARTVERQEKQDRSQDAENDALKNIYSPDPKQQSKVSAKSIVNNDNLLPQTKKNLINIIEREAKPETERRISEATTVDFLRRMRAPDADLPKILNDAYDARGKDPGTAGSLTRADFNEIRGEISGRRDPVQAALDKSRGEFFNRYISTIDPNRDKATGLGGSALGDQKIYQAAQDAKRLERVLESKGQDPHSLYDPTSPNFFGKSIQKYRPTMQEETDFKKQLQADKSRKEIENVSSTAGKATGVTPTRVRQNGHTYEKQPDGQYRVVE